MTDPSANRKIYLALGIKLGLETCLSPSSQIYFPVALVVSHYLYITIYMYNYMLAAIANSINFSKYFNYIILPLSGTVNKICMAIFLMQSIFCYAKQHTKQSDVLFCLRHAYVYVLMHRHFHNCIIMDFCST